MTKEERRAMQRIYYHANIDQYRATRRAWYAANREKARGYTRKWRKKKGLWKGTKKNITWSKWDEARIARLRELCAKGTHLKVCGEILGCSASACREACHRNGIPLPLHPEKPIQLPVFRSSRRESPQQSAMWAKLLAGARA